MSNLKKSISIAMGATFAASMAATPIANADENPFGMQNLESGYLQVAEAEGKCGEGKCGEGKKEKEEKDMEAKCGEGKCGEKKPEPAKQMEGKCGEGKCGEGKNGGNS